MKKGKKMLAITEHITTREQKVRTWNKYTGNNNLVHETNHDYKRRNKNLACTEQIMLQREQKIRPRNKYRLYVGKYYLQTTTKERTKS
jgi:hypothetical protein